MRGPGATWGLFKFTVAASTHRVCDKFFGKCDPKYSREPQKDTKKAPCIKELMHWVGLYETKRMVVPTGIEPVSPA